MYKISVFSDTNEKISPMESGKEDSMRKKYGYVITLILLSVLLWTGYYFYLLHRPVSYENGTFVEIPLEIVDGMMELCA